MSSNGVKVKQQFLCTLDFSIRHLKGIPFFPPKSLFNMRLLNTKPPRKLKMLKKIRFFSLWFLTPNWRQDYSCQNISQTSKNIYIFFKEEYFNIYLLNQNTFFSITICKEQLPPLKLCIQVLLPLCFTLLKKLLLMSQLHQDLSSLHSFYRQ